MPCKKSCISDYQNDLVFDKAFGLGRMVVRGWIIADAVEVVLFSRRQSMWACRRDQQGSGPRNDPFGIVARASEMSLLSVTVTQRPDGNGLRRILLSHEARSDRRTEKSSLFLSFISLDAIKFHRWNLSEKSSHQLTCKPDVSNVKPT
jgi:hypothetical protein